jgi:endonuclease/exonuclease/phosphatase family metal-dependent hydrolase
MIRRSHAFALLFAIAFRPDATLAVDDGAGGAICRVSDPSRRVVATETLDVLSLNVGHARGTALNQLLVPRNRHRRNLDEIAALLMRTGADVVGLQEADAPSWWSGRFDHVEFLSDATDYACSVHGHHADSWLYTFGAALISRFELSDIASHTFQPSPPTTTKGFVRGTVQWRSGGDDAIVRPITLISVHLDFSRREVRKAQAAEMVEALSGLSTPLVVLGDFNDDWTLEDSPVRRIASEFGLRAFTPTAPELGTYKRTKRLDWILISDELEFVDYVVLPDVVSDHRPLMVRIGWQAGR